MDAAAVINVDKELAYIGEDVTMTARSYLANSSNMEYAWEIKSADGIDGKIASK